MKRPKYLPIGFSKVLATGEEIREWAEGHRSLPPPRVRCDTCQRRMWAQGIGSHKKAGCAPPGSKRIALVEDV